jgi:hypothetical protein
MTRFPLGSYIQVDNEIMRIASSSLSGTPTNKITVIRGALATSPTSHVENSTIRKIKVPSIEFRRPSIIRASGHTFEYLGYGPGNYSTALPQVQDRTLTEREEFLSQAQERSSGLVVYTGMNNKGDFYIGNQKKSSATGEETNFDIPVPTITGEDPSRLSAVFDEVTIKERLVVEGGDSNQVLSQFNGPVTFDEKVKVNGQVKIANATDSTGTTSGALVVTGGVGIGNNVNIGGSMFFPDDKKLYFGTGNDLAIYHNGTTNYSYIEEIGSGGLVLKTNEFRLRDSTDNENIIQAIEGAQVELYYNNAIKFETLNTGAKVTGELQVTDDITAFYSSDERLKDNINLIDNSLEKVISISGNTFDWNDKSNKEGSDTGLIAQEVESLGLPGLVTTRDNGYLAVDYHKVVPLLVEAIKELSDKVEKLEQRLEDK